MSLDRELQLSTIPLPVCGIRHDLPNPLLNLRNVQGLVACELGTTRVLPWLVPEVNALRMNAVDTVVPDAEMPEPSVSGSDWSFEILAAPPHCNARCVNAV